MNCSSRLRVSAWTFHLRRLSLGVPCMHLGLFELSAEVNVCLNFSVSILAGINSVDLTTQSTIC